MNNKANVKIIAAVIGALGLVFAAIVTGGFGLLNRSAADDQRQSNVNSPQFVNNPQIVVNVGSTSTAVGAPTAAYVSPTQTHLSPTPVETTKPSPVPVPVPTDTPKPTDRPVLPSPTEPLPTATAVPTPATRILFEDSFDSEPKPAWRDEGGGWRVVNDEFSISEIDTQRPPQGPYSGGLVTVGDDSWRDYRVRVKMDLKGSYGENGGGVLIRQQDKRHLLQLIFRDRGDPWCAWFIVKDGRAVEVPQTRFRDYPLDRPFTVEIEAVGDVIDTYVDGYKVNSWSNAPYLTGSVGLIMGSRTIERTLSFDDVLIEEL